MIEGNRHRFSRETLFESQPHCLNYALSGVSTDVVLCRGR